MKLWHQPRRSRWRKPLLQLHLWLGVGLGIYAAVIGLSGSALVFAPELERTIHPELFHLAQPGTAGVPLARILAETRQKLPRAAVLGIDEIDRPRQPIVVYLTDRGQERTVYVDRTTGQMLGAPLRYAGVLGWCANLHVYLLAGSTGYLVNGLCGLGFLLLCVSGWLLWWPGAGYMRRGLRVHWRGRAKRRNWDLHAVGGFWTNFLLLGVVATGVLFIFPRPALLGLAWLTGGGARSVDAWLAAAPASPHPTSAMLSPDSALARAHVVLAGRGEASYTVHYLALPATPGSAYDAIAYPPGTVDYAMPVYIYLDGETGATLWVEDARDQPLGIRLASYAYALHFGTLGGMTMRVLWVLLGLAPAALWCTGLLLWWNRSLRQRLTRVSPMRPALPEGV